MEIRGKVEAEPVGDVTAALGEGPYWVPDEDRLLWVDIPEGQVHRTDVASGVTESIKVEPEGRPGEHGQGNTVSAAFPVAGGGILVAGRRELTLRFDAEDAKDGEDGEPRPSRVVAEVPPADGVRFNDGAVDPAGRVWIGSMHTGETEPLGELYRLDGSVLTPVVRKVTISNGLGWNPEGSLMYYVDSPSRKIDVFDYDPATGEVSGRRLFADLRYADGTPDGLTVDADGCVWVAMWGGAALRRFTPAAKPDVMLPVPVARPTSCAFGGPDLSELYVTTASIGLSEEARAAQPLAGRLLRLRPGPVGLPSATASAMLPSPPDDSALADAPDESVLARIASLADFTGSSTPGKPLDKPSLGKPSPGKAERPQGS
ncbi:MAG: SMP-30/gluconolactonase/LRE family protein [Nocardiopsaceae bacterium]|nr:SMP-30/gluconolactonase/LRE family protein [Nocardiopsaceae bacterium]